MWNKDQRATTMSACFNDNVKVSLVWCRFYIQDCWNLQLYMMEQRLQAAVDMMLEFECKYMPVRARVCVCRLGVVGWSSIWVTQTSHAPPPPPRKQADVKWDVPPWWGTGSHRTGANNRTGGTERERNAFLPTPPTPTPPPPPSPKHNKSGVHMLPGKKLRWHKHASTARGPLHSITTTATNKQIKRLLLLFSDTFLNSHQK